MCRLVAGQGWQENRSIGKGVGGPQDTPLPLLQPPKRIKDYILGPILGEGTYGKVREAIHTPTLKRVAIKVTKKRNLKKVKGGLANIETGIMIMRQLASDSCAANHVLSLEKVVRCDDKIGIVMDLALASLQHLIDCQVRHPSLYFHASLH